MTSLLKQLQPPERVETKIQAHASKSKEAAMRRRGEQPLRQELWRLAGADLTSIDGISPPAALVILTELALDLAAFPSEQQFVSWLRLAPWLAISAGRPVKKKPNGSGSNRVAGGDWIGQSKRLSRQRSIGHAPADTAE